MLVELLESYKIDFEGWNIQDGEQDELVRPDDEKIGPLRELVANSNLPKEIQCNFFLPSAAFPMVVCTKVAWVGPNIPCSLEFDGQ